MDGAARLNPQQLHQLISSVSLQTKGPTLYDSIIFWVKRRKVLTTELEQYLHDHIPLSKAMDVTVVSADAESVILQAPLAPNINHRDTVFGGSASAVAILAAWCLLYTRLRGEGIDARLVIQRNTMEYDKPIWGDFTARSSLEHEGDWAKFTRMLERKGKARITVLSLLEHSGDVVGRLSGEFVALGKKDS